MTIKEQLASSNANKVYQDAVKWNNNIPFTSEEIDEFIILFKKWYIKWNEEQDKTEQDRFKGWTDNDHELFNDAVNS